MVETKMRKKHESISTHHPSKMGGKDIILHPRMPMINQCILLIFPLL
jgi:hypothetical protein